MDALLIYLLTLPPNANFGRITRSPRSRPDFLCRVCRDGRHMAALGGRWSQEVPEALQNGVPRLGVFASVLVRGRLRLLPRCSGRGGPALLVERPFRSDPPSRFALRPGHAAWAPCKSGRANSAAKLHGLTPCSLAVPRGESGSVVATFPRRTAASHTFCLHMSNCYLSMRRRQPAIVVAQSGRGHAAILVAQRCWKGMRRCEKECQDMRRGHPAILVAQRGQKGKGRRGVGSWMCGEGSLQIWSRRVGVDTLQVWSHTLPGKSCAWSRCGPKSAERY